MMDKVWLTFIPVRDLVFFFQAEDGIRGFHVTGVQTCALPILRRRCRAWSNPTSAIPFGEAHDEAEVGFGQARHRRLIAVALNTVPELALFLDRQARQLRDLAQIRRERTRLTLARSMPSRSEERRVGKECRAGWTW